MPGQDFEVPAEISIEDAFRGTTLELQLSMPEYDASGRLHRVPHNVKARIPPGAVDGQRLRLPGKGGKGFNGGRDGDLYLDISLKPHRLYRATGHDLYVDLPLAPWEAALGAAVEVPTPAGRGEPQGAGRTSSGQKLRLAGRGLPRPRGTAGDLYAVAQIVVAPQLDERERELYSSLKEVSGFDPRKNFTRGRMSMENEALWLDENRVVGLGELVEISGLTREELIELVQGGAIPVREVHGTDYTFSAQRDQRGTHRLPAARRTRTRHAGLAVALRLLDRVRGLEEEIARLRALLPRRLVSVR